MYSGNTAFNSYAGHGVGGGGYSGYSALSTANISYETNSKDPVLLRARVFVGNLSPKVGRDEIIQLFRTYGTLLGVTVFKGYAFVQYSHGSEADLAVSSLNTYNWNGSVLDVKLAISGHGPAGSHPNKPSSASHLSQALAITARGMAMGKRNQHQFVQQLPNKDPKRMKVDQLGGGGASAMVVASPQQQQNFNQEKANKAYATNFDTSECSNFQQNDIYDTLICGGCRYVTTDLAEFVEHRKQPCKQPKADGEPDALACTNCNEHFITSWSLLSHLSTAHNNSLFKEVHYPTAKASGENGANNGSEDGKVEAQSKDSADVSMEQK